MTKPGAVRSLIYALAWAFAVAGFGVGVHAEPGFVGLQVQGMDPKVAKALGRRSPNGVFIKDVAVGEPGAIAGLRRGDIITRFANKTIRKFADLLSAVGGTKPGQNIRIEVERQGRTVKLSMKTTPRPSQWKVTKDAFRNYPQLGFTVAVLTAKVRERFTVRWGATGLIVTLVAEEGIVGKIKGLKAGDVIIQANLKDLWHPRHLSRQIDDVRKAGRDSILLLIEGTDGYRYSLMPLSEK